MIGHDPTRKKPTNYEAASRGCPASQLISHSISFAASRSYAAIAVGTCLGRTAGAASACHGA